MLRKSRELVEMHLVVGVWLRGTYPPPLVSLRQICCLLHKIWEQVLMHAHLQFSVVELKRYNCQPAS